MKRLKQIQNLQEPKKMVSIRLEQSLIDKIRRNADEKGVAFVDIIREAVLLYDKN